MFQRSVLVERYPPPVTVRVVVPLPTGTVAGLIDVMVGMAAGPTTKVCTPEVPPPGMGEVAVMATVPASTRLALTVARTSVAL